MPAHRIEKINDFALKLANVNGTGSASANGLLMQAIFRMGIPVSGKNLFPSNIQGLPTWYEIRVNGDGHVARTPEFELFVAMNAETYAADIREVQAGGWVIYDSTLPLDKAPERADVTILPVPHARLFGEVFLPHANCLETMLTNTNPVAHGPASFRPRAGWTWAMLVISCSLAMPPVCC